jgi:hypothetical protein
VTSDAGNGATAPPQRRSWPRAPWTFGSGPGVASLFGMLLALISLVAWLSLGAQVLALVGSRGLLPLADFIEAARDAGLARWGRLPTIFLWTQSDRALAAGVAVGVGLSLSALLGLRRRLCFALSTALYLSYAVAARVFLGFQWDNLLLECGLCAVFLPATRRAPLAHFLFRALLFKLYFESGLAKWQSPLGDWQDGSAMTYYYETAPLPTALAFYAHNLPVWWHHLESRATLVLELVAPFGIFGPRRARLSTALALTAFQLVNAATANYGFFCHLAVALHVFLLDDADLGRFRRLLLPRSTARVSAPRAKPAPDGAQERGLAVRALDRAAARVGVAAYLAVSFASAAFVFGGGEPGAVLRALAPLVDRAEMLRIVNTYHLFASITRERIEPELQTLAPGGDEEDDAAWTAHDLRHKPGTPTRAPDFVAPHQPRLDFQLWFHGLAFRRGQPPYLRMLLERMCEDSDAVRPFFRESARDALPPHPRAARVVYWQYHFTTPAEKQATGAWWRRERLAATAPVRCASST